MSNKLIPIIILYFTYNTLILKDFINPNKKVMIIKSHIITPHEPLSDIFRSCFQGKPTD